MKFADRLGRIQPSATLTVNAKAMELKAKGVAITNLSLGEPDFATPPHIAEAAKRAIDDKFFHYTPVEGIVELRRAVCGYFQKEYGVSSEASNVILTNGGKQSLYEVLLALLNDGDEVLIPLPYWTSYPNMVLLTGGKPVYVPSPSERGFRINAEDLEKARTPKTRALILNSPSNPTGVTYKEEELEQLILWAVHHNIVVISDEMYDQLVFAPAKAASASVLWQKYPEHIAVLGGLSKSFAMTGWRVGYTLGHQDLIRQMTKIQGQMTSNICSIAQKASLVALESSFDCVAEMRDAFCRRRDMALAEIATWPGVVCPKPEGAFYLFPDVRSAFTSAMPDATSVCTYLLESAQVAVMPGEAFGDKNCLRFAYAVADEELKEALARIGKALFNR